MFYDYSNYTLILLLAASFLSEYLLTGKIHYRCHVVNLMGYAVNLTEKIFYKLSNSFLTGVVFNISTLFIVSGILIFLSSIIIKISLWLFYVFFVYLVSSFISTGGLKHAGLRVYNDLKGDDLPGARKNIISLAGRDSERLDAPEISRAAIESIAENTGDGVGSVFFYIAAGFLAQRLFIYFYAGNTNLSLILIFGLAGGVIYKTVNLMDSLVGYKNDRYLRFGKFSAKLDDILNYIPFRLTAVFMILSVVILRVSGKNYDIKNALKAWSIFKRMHPSPNAGQLESVMAGALKIRLGGINYYGGRRSERPVIGFKYYGEATKDDILRAIRIMELTSAVLAAFYILASILLR